MSEVERLRAAVRQATGGARAKPLVELTQALIRRYVDVGPGKDAARPPLDEAIGTADEACVLFGRDDPMRAQVVATRGWLRGTRHVTLAGVEGDRPAAIADLEEGLRSPHLSPGNEASCRLVLGQLYLSEVTTVLRSPDMSSMLLNGSMPTTAMADVDRAIAVFRRSLAGPALGRDMQDVTRVQLRLAEALKAMVGAASAAGSPHDRVTAVMDSMRAIQEIHQEQLDLMRQGPDRPGRSFYFADELVDRDPIDRPTVLVEVEDPYEPPVPVVTRPVPTDVPGARRRLRRRVAAGGDLIESLETLLGPGATPDAALIDDIVALATSVVDTGEANATDHLLLAAGMALRVARAGGDEWDRAEAADALAKSAAGRRIVAPDVARIMRRIDTMIAKD